LPRKFYFRIPLVSGGITAIVRAKVRLVERAIHNIDRDAARAYESTSAKLDKFLNTND